MAEKLSRILGIRIQYKSPNLISFFLAKRKEKLPPMMIFVMIMLHYIPRFQQESATTEWVEKITHTPPATFEQFVIDHKKKLMV